MAFDGGLNCFGRVGNAGFLADVAALTGGARLLSLLLPATFLLFDDEDDDVAVGVVVVVAVAADAAVD